MRSPSVITSLALAAVVGCTSTPDGSRRTVMDGGRDARASSSGASGSGGNGAGGGGTASGGTGVGGGAPRDASPQADGARDASVEGGEDASATGDASASRVGHLEWQVFYDHAYAAHVESDSASAALVSGTFFDTKDLTVGKTTLKSHGGPDVFLSHVFETGLADWTRGYGGTADDYPVSFALDPQDRIALVGLYNGVGNIGGLDLPAFAGTPTRFNVYTAELSRAGDHVWSSIVSTTEDSFGGPGLSWDGLGGILVPGYFTGTATIGGVGHASAGGTDAFVARYSSKPREAGVSLGFDDAYTLGAGGNDRAVAALRTSGGVILVGQFQGSITVPTLPTPTTLTSNGGTDVFVALGSVDGVLEEALSFGGTGDDVVSNARFDGSGLVLAGSFDSPSLSIFGGAPLLAAGGRDGFVAKLDATLAHVWSQRFGDAGDDVVRDVAVGNDGTLAITGEFAHRIGIGGNLWNAAPPSDAGPSGPDFFVAKLSASGEAIWSFATGGPLTERGLSVAIDANGHVYATSSFQSPVDFGGGAVLTPDSSRIASALLRYAP